MEHHPEYFQTGPWQLVAVGHNIINEEAESQSKLERSTNGEGHNNDNGTTPVTVLLKASNWMTEDEMICKPVMQLKYIMIKSNANGQDMTLVCCHRVLITALILFHAPNITCTAVSLCHFARIADNASHCVKSTRTVVYTFQIELSHHYPPRKVMQTYQVKCPEKYLQGNNHTCVINRLGTNAPGV